MPVVAGRVLDAAGEPVDLARVAFAATPVTLPDVAAVTGPDGRFALVAPVAGRYVLAAVGEGHPPAHLTADVRSERLELEITLAEERT